MVSYRVTKSWQTHLQLLSWSKFVQSIQTSLDILDQFLALSIHNMVLVVNIVFSLIGFKYVFDIGIEYYILLTFNILQLSNLAYEKDIRIKVFQLI